MMTVIRCPSAGADDRRKAGRPGAVDGALAAAARIRRQIAAIKAAPGYLPAGDARCVRLRRRHAAAIDAARRAAAGSMEVQS